MQKRKSRLGWVLLSGASLAAMGGQAFAQDAGEPMVSDEIVVTATGREAAIQDVPLAVTAIGGEALQNAGVQDVRDVEQLAPALRIATGQSNSAGTIARIRGIGTGGDNPGFEPAVGIFIDGVYRARAGIALSDLPEVDRIEVLRGPQGTLFGRNTSAGAISIVTSGPDYEPHAWMEGMVGLDDLHELGGKFGINLPATDALAFRFDGSVRGRDGYITDVISDDDINDRNRWTARGQVLWDISPDASFRLIADTAYTDEVCCTAVTFQRGSVFGAIMNGITNAVYPGFGANQAVLTANPEARRMSVSPGRDYGEQVEEWGVSGELSWAIGDMNLTSITAYRDWTAERNQDIDFSLLDRAYRDGLEIGFETLTQEFRLQGEAGPVNWLVGAFYGDESLEQTDTIRTGFDAALYGNAVISALSGGLEPYLDASPSPSLLFVISPALAGTYLTAPGDGDGQQADYFAVDTTTWSVFTHNEIALSDVLTLTLGARFNRDEKELTGDLDSDFASCDELRGISLGLTQLQRDAIMNSAAGGLFTLACNPVVNTVANGTYAHSTEEDAWNGTASLAWNLTDDVMLYGGYSRGYKAGGYNVDRSGFNITALSVAQPSASDLAFGSETVDAYEVGLKTTLFDGSTFFNVNGFYEQIHDYQLNAFSGFNFITRNVEEVISRGVEVDILTRPMDNLTFQGGVVWNEAFFDSTTSFNAGGTVLAGTPIAGAPEWSVTGAVTYEVPLGDNLRALFYVDGRWNDDYVLQTLNRNPATDQGGFALFNARVGIGGQDGTWSLDFWGRNLTDEYYNVGVFAVPEQSGISIAASNYAVYPSEPRTFGVTLRARY